jgi:imidazolonepropionase-like amidohydrolase
MTLSPWNRGSRLAFVAAASFALAITGARADRPRTYALTGAHVYVAPGKVLAKATVVIRDGLIESVGADVKPPADAVVIDASGKVIHAGYIDACGEIGTRPEPASRPQGKDETQAGAAHPIAGIRPERRLFQEITFTDKERSTHRNLGFTSILAVPKAGIFRGTSALVSLGDGSVADNLVRTDVAQHVSFDSGNFGEAFPTSLMGAIAAVRQGFLDAKRHEEWQAMWEADPRGLKRPDMNSAWAPLAAAAAGKMPVAFNAETPLRAGQSLAVANEFHLDAWLVGSGRDSEALDELRAARRPVIVPLALPDKPDLGEPDEVASVETRSLERFFTVRENAGKLVAAGLPVAFGTCRMKSVGDVPSNLRKVIAAGLSEEAALAALTTVPAKLFGADRTLGTIEPGKAADLVVESGPLFGEKTKPERVFVDGREYAVDDKPRKGDPNAFADPKGTWAVVWTMPNGTGNRVWTLAGTPGAWRGTAETSEGTVTFTSVRLEGNELTVTYPARGGAPAFDVVVVITGDTFSGDGELPGGQSFRIRGTRTGPQSLGGGSLEDDAGAHEDHENEPHAGGGR